MKIRTTQELASWVLGESPSSRTRATSSSGHHGLSLSDTEFEVRRNNTGSIFSDSEQEEYRDSIDSLRPEVIEEVSESVSPDEHNDQQPKLKPQLSTPSHFIQHTPSKNYLTANSIETYADIDLLVSPNNIAEGNDVTESTSLLPRPRLTEPPNNRKRDIAYTERHWGRRKGRWGIFRYELAKAWGTTTSPSEWDLRHASSIVIGAFAAVFLGLLLNVLDALSYGKIFSDTVPVLT